MKFLVVVKKVENNFAAYLPNLSGCIATGAILEEVQTNIRFAVAMHIERRREDGLPVPEPQA